MGHRLPSWKPIPAGQPRTFFQRRTQRHTQWDRDPRPLALRRPTHFRLLVVLGTLLLLGGLLLFASSQTQALFKDVHGLQLHGNQNSGNDAGTLFGGLIATTGVGLLLWGLSPVPPHRRVPPLLGVLIPAWILLVAHFNIFVNGWTIESERIAIVEASFLFHDTSFTLPIATFSLALATLLLIILVITSLAALLTPELYRKHLLEPRTLEENRTRLVLATLLLIGAGAIFIHQFFAFAITTDASPSGGFIYMNLIAVYYLLASILAVAFAALTWRTFLLCWGRLRDRSTRRFRRGLNRLRRAENWLWGTAMLFNAILLIAPPVFIPQDVDRVFAVNSRGVSWIFFIVFGLYLLQRRLSRSHYRFLLANQPSLPTQRFDRLALVSLVVLASWILIGPLLWWATQSLFSTDELTPLTKLVLQIAPIAIALPWFTLRLDTRDVIHLRTSSPSAPLLMLTATAASILCGIMIWGIGNSVGVQFHLAQGGFLTPQDRLLQPYSTGIRLLAALFFALPIVILLWLLGNRHRHAVQPGPLLVSGFALVLCMNILFTIDPISRFDATLGYTDIVIGFWTMLLDTHVDTAAMLVLWGATAIVGVVAAGSILRRGLPPEEYIAHKIPRSA